MDSRSEDQDFWLIEQVYAECIQKNIDNYVQQPHDPVVIIVGNCPDEDIAAGISATTKATGINTVGKGNSVLIFNKSELPCLATVSLNPDESGLVKIPRKLSCD